jgi:hypothetical protein
MKYWSRSSPVFPSKNRSPLSVGSIAAYRGFSGVYRVEDTGGRIRGRKIDIYMPSRGAAKQFGRQTVKVEVLTPPNRRRQGLFARLLFWRRS